MPRKKRPSQIALLEELLEGFVADSAPGVSPDPPTWLPLVGRIPEKESLHDSECRSIVEFVEANPLFVEILRGMLERKFLLPGVFHPLAYMRDVDRIESAWKKSKSKDSALAMGVSLCDQFFFEGLSAIRSKGNFIVSRKARGRVKRWESEIQKLFPNDSQEIIAAAWSIGQYLEFRNRKAQGF